MIKLAALLLIASPAVIAGGWNEPDKVMHIKAGLAISSLSQLAFEDWRISLGLCGGAAIGKELLDEINYGGFDKNDAAATFFGGCVPGVLLGDTMLKGLSWDSSRGIQYSLEYEF